jgi:urease accessory protein UreE
VKAISGDVGTTETQAMIKKLAIEDGRSVVLRREEGDRVFFTKGVIAYEGRTWYAVMLDNEALIKIRKNSGREYRVKYGGWTLYEMNEKVN